MLQRQNKKWGFMGRYYKIYSFYFNFECSGKSRKYGKKEADKIYEQEVNGRCAAHLFLFFS